MSVHTLDSVLTVFSNAFSDINSTACVGRDKDTENIFGIFIVWSFAVVFTIILFIAQKRTNLRPDRCYGRPGVPVPLDFLVSPRNRLVYSVLFAIMGTGLINDYGNFGGVLGGALEADDIFTTLFNKILWTPFFTVMTLVLEYFPLFASVEHPVPCIGHSIGCIYSVIWFLTLWVPRFVEYGQFVEVCSLTNSRGRSLAVITILKDGPLIALSAFIVVWFSFKMGSTCCWKPFRIKVEKSELKALDDWKYGIRSYHLDRVRALLKKPPAEKQPSNKVLQLLVKVVRYMFPFKRNYKLPLPLLGAIVAMVMIIYQISCSLITQTFLALTVIVPLYKDAFKPLFDDVSLLVPEDYQGYLSTISEGFQAVIFGIPAIAIVSPFLSVILCMFLLIHLVASISKEIKAASKHGFQERLPKRAKRLSGFWKYIGLQTGLFITAWAIYTGLFMLVGLVLMVFWFVLKSSAGRRWIFNILLGIVVPLIWAKLLFFFQSLICKRVFLDKRDKTDSKFISVRHRRIYNWFSYVLFFYNGFAGLVGAAVRIVYATLFSLLLLFRLDTVALPKQLWWWDFGHKTFLGFLYMDYCYNHPVLHVFSHVLENSVHKDRGKDEEEGNVELVEADEFEKRNARSRQVRNRWLVAYTLVRNPSIQQYTAKNLELLQVERKTDPVFVLRHTIKGVQEDQESTDEAFLDNLEKKGDLGVEITPNDGLVEEQEVTIDLEMANSVGGKPHQD